MTFRQIGHGPSLSDGRITPEDLAAYVALLRHTSTLREDHRLAGAFLSWRHGLNRTLLSPEMLARVTTPTLFIWEERDPFGGPETARGVVELLPNASLHVVANAGHAPWLDDLSGCADAVREHLPFA